MIQAPGEGLTFKIYIKRPHFLFKLVVSENILSIFAEKMTEGEHESEERERDRERERERERGRERRF
jgi:hypothetical protein